MILIILPVKDKIDGVYQAAKELVSWCDREFKDDYRVFFIDDLREGKLDGLYLENGKCSVIKNKFDKGKGSALKTGFIISENMYKLNPEDIIVFMDSDGQIIHSEIKTFLNIMNLYNADVVIGNKRHMYSNISYTLTRRIISRCYNFIIRFLFGIKYEDTQCGLKIFKKKALDKVIEKITVKKFAFDLELIISLREMKMRIADAPVRVRDQINAGSVSISSVITTFIDTMLVWKNFKKGFYRKK